MKSEARRRSDCTMVSHRLSGPLRTALSSHGGRPGILFRSLSQRGSAMNEITVRRPQPWAFSTSRPARASGALGALLLSAEESQYREMEDAFRATGGIAGSEEMTRLLGAHSDQPISLLARWIVAHEVLGFEWRGRTLVPMFQFDRATMTPRAAVVETVRELVPVLSDWDASLWFARPNGWLADARPVDAIARDPRAVFHAARADRYLAHA